MLNELRRLLVTLRTPKIKNYETYKPLFRRKRGLEIGGPSGIFESWGLVPIYPLAKTVDNCNFSNQTVWEGKIRAGGLFKGDFGRRLGRQYITEATRIDFAKDESYDFLLSSHVLEHLANPLLGLEEWLRVLKTGGLLLSIVPHKDGTFDHKRKITSLRHMISDYRKKRGEDDLYHLPEILRFHDLRRDPKAGGRVKFIARSKENALNRCLHHHVFDTRLVVKLYEYFNLEVIDVSLERPYQIIVLGRKTRGKPRPNSFMTILRDSPFPSDRTIKRYNRL